MPSACAAFRQLSPPLCISELPNKGRCFLSNRPIKAGELLLSAHPYSAIADTQNLSLACSNCLQLVGHYGTIQKQLIPCPGNCSARHLHYCSNECRMEDWERFHQFECGYYGREDVKERMAGFSEYQQDYMFLLNRCLLRRQRELQSCNIASETDGLRFDSVWALCSNRESFPEDAIAGFRKTALFMLDFWKWIGSQSTESIFDNCGFELDWIIDLICKEECNSFGMYDKSFMGMDCKYAYGLSVYPEAVYFNHSCSPNVVHCTKGRQQLFYACRDIEAGQELCITYISIRQPFQERMDELKRVFLFDCSCRRCLSGDRECASEVDEYLCNSCIKGVFLPFKACDDDVSLEWKCEACNQLRS